MSCKALIRAVGLLGLLVFAQSSLSAAPGGDVERVLLKEGKLLAVRGGQTTPVTEELQLPHDITVATNATYRVGKGRWHKLLEGQVLDRDGMLLSPDGSLRAVFDHVVMKNGRPHVQRDGDRQPITAPLTLKDGSVVTPEGYHIRTDGRKVWMLDGEMLTLDGRPIAAKDTIALVRGQVVVQKDGSLIHVARRQSLMMNDGTKVFGDGTVVFKDGRRKQLQEGEILTVQGVVRRLP